MWGGRSAARASSGGPLLKKRADREHLLRARALRSHATSSEQKLWRELRVLRGRGFHFRRQAPFRGYILDFVEHGLKLVIEVDGGSHAAPENVAHDAVRDAVLNTEGYDTLRVWNDEINADMNGVMETVHRVIEGRRRVVGAAAPYLERRILGAAAPHPDRCALRPPHKGGG